MITREEHLQRVDEVRKMEFEARVNDLQALRKALGDQVIEIVSAERGRRVEEQWRAIAQELGRNDIEGIKQTLWKWVGEAGFEFTFTDTEEGTQFHVTRCPLAEMAHALNAQEWGYICFCADDPHMVAGFNPAIEFRRTKTLMEGHDHCNHSYYMRKRPE